MVAAKRGNNFNASTGACTATLAAFQSVSGTVTQLYSQPVACHNGSVLRTAIIGSVAYIILDGKAAWVPGVTVSGKVSAKTLIVESANHISMGGAQASGSLTASYNYDNQGALTSVVYPSPTQTFTYTLDAMERPTSLTDNYLNRTWASGATYNAANQPLYDGTATRTYNNLLQMTSMIGTGMSMAYNYKATQNSGQITSSVDSIKRNDRLPVRCIEAAAIGNGQQLGRDVQLRRVWQPDSDESYGHSRRAHPERHCGPHNEPSDTLRNAIRQQREPAGRFCGHSPAVRRGEPGVGGDGERRELLLRV
jgi:hypothetical protein